MLSPLLPLGFTLEAPVVYDANIFSGNHIKCSIDCKHDIILFSTQTFTSLMVEGK